MTLLRVLARLTRISEGEAEIFGDHLQTALGCTGFTAGCVRVDVRVI